MTRQETVQRPESAPEEVIDKDRRLGTLIRAARAFEALDRYLQPVLSERARGHVQVACVDGQTLILVAESSAWATLARLEAESCLEAAQSVWPSDIDSVKVIVQRPIDGP